MTDYPDGVNGDVYDDSNNGENVSEFEEKDEDEGSEYQLETEGLSDDGGYDDSGDEDWEGDSDDSGRKRRSKRKRGKQQDARDNKRGRRDPPNAMQSKLRSAAPRVQEDHESFESEDFEEDRVPPPPRVVSPPRPPPLERNLTPEEIEDELNTIGPMWEMASVLDFLHRFSDQLKMSNKEFTPNDVAYELVVGTGDQGLLAQIHVDLLRGLSSKSDLNGSNWQSYVAHKVRGMVVLVNGVPTVLFEAMKGEEAVVYSKMPTAQRVVLLKTICELRCDRDDIRLRIEFAVNPKKAKQMMAEKHSRGRAPVLPAKPETIEAFRPRPAGVDSYGMRYWFVDFMHSTDTLLYRECPPSPPPSPPPLPKPPKPTGRKAKGKTKPQPISLGGSRVADVQSGEWALMATSAEDLQEVAEELMRTRKKADTKIAKWIYDEVLTLLDMRKAEVERKAKLAERLRRQIGNVLLDEDGGYGRPRRERKKVNYNMEEYDNLINEAIKNTRKAEPTKPTRRATAVEPPAMPRGTRRTRGHVGSLNEDDLAGDEDSGSQWNHASRASRQIEDRRGTHTEDDYDATGNGYGGEGGYHGEEEGYEEEYEGGRYDAPPDIPRARAATNNQPRYGDESAADDYGTGSGQVDPQEDEEYDDVGGRGEDDEYMVDGEGEEDDDDYDGQDSERW